MCGGGRDCLCALLRVLTVTEMRRWDEKKKRIQGPGERSEII